MARAAEEKRAAAARLAEERRAEAERKKEEARWGWGAGGAGGMFACRGQALGVFRLHVGGVSDRKGCCLRVSVVV
jgi:hypothetical protein